MTTIDIITLDRTPFGALDTQGRLLNAVLKEPLPDPRRFGYRGDIALKFQEQFADEKRPPEYSIEQVLAAADVEAGTIPVLAAYLHNFAWLRDAETVLAPWLDAAGTYVFFANNIDLLKKYRVPFGPTIAHVLPLDESTVWKETLELVGLDKNDLKKLDGAGKLARVLDELKGIRGRFEDISYDEGVARMEPVRNRNANRPV